MQSRYTHHADGTPTRRHERVQVTLDDRWPVDVNLRADRLCAQIFIEVDIDNDMLLTVDEVPPPPHFCFAMFVQPCACGMLWVFGNTSIISDTVRALCTPVCVR